jgi:PKD repeat protein
MKRFIYIFSIFFFIQQNGIAQYTVTLNSTNVTCFGAANGTITTVVNGGIPPINFNWLDLPPTNDPQNRTNLTPNTYTLVVTDGSGATIIKSATITQPAQIIATTAIQNILCGGQNNGAITINVSGSQTQYTYDWADVPGSNNSLNRTNLAAGTYSIVISNLLNGCTDSGNYTISSPNPILIDATKTNVTCFGSANGTISPVASGGSGNFFYDWADLPGGNNGANRTNLVAGTYNLTVLDANQCSKTASYIITQPTAFTSTAVTTNVTCNGANNGAINITASGGTPPYNYDWDDIADTDNPEDRMGLAPGFYAVFLTDANGCMTNKMATITQPNAIQIVITSKTDASCGSSNGTASVAANNGIGTATFAWNNGQTGSTANNLAAGIYTVTATYSNGCSASIPVQINQTNSFSLIGQSPAPLMCHGQSNGFLQVMATAGTPPYTYLWSNGATTPTITNLPAGIYTVTASDAGGCQTPLFFTITEPAILQANLSMQSAQCFGSNTGVAISTPIGGTAPYSFLWQNNSTNDTLAGVAAGIYRVSVTDVHGCLRSDSVIVTQPTALNLSVNATNLVCNGNQNGSAQATVSGGSGGYIYFWSNGQTTNTISNVSAGSYYVVVTDAHGCTAMAFATISTPDPIFLLYSVIEPPSCFGGNNGAVQIQAMGGTTPYNIIWSNGQTGTSINNLAAGTYASTLTDANGCILQGSIDISQPDLLVTTEYMHQDINCTTGSVCYTETNVVGGTEPYHYLWSSGEDSPDIAAKKAGTYILTVTDNKGCTSTFSTTFTKIGQLDIQTALVIPVKCPDSSGSIFLYNNMSGFPPIQYNWSNGLTGAHIDAPVGPYQVMATDSIGCADTLSVTIENDPNQIQLIYFVDAITCGNGSDGHIGVVLSGGAPPFNILWSTGDVNITEIADLPAGNYWVKITDAVGCVVLKSFNLGGPPPLVVELNVMDISAIGANDGSISVQSISGGTPPYSLFNPDGTPWVSLTNLAPGTYSFNILDANGCQSSETVVITGAAPVPALSTNVSKGCAPLTVHFSDQSTGNPTSWLWQFTVGGNTTTSILQNPTITFTESGQTVNVMLKTCNALGCTEKLFTNVVQIKPNAISQFAFANTGNPLSIQFQNMSANAQTILWNFGDGTFSQIPDPLHTFPNYGNYTVTLTVVSECDTAVLSKIVMLTVGTESIFEEKNIKISPNPTNGICKIDFDNFPKNTQIECVNQLGQIVFFNKNLLEKSTELDFSNQPNGVYWLKIRAENQSFFKKIVVVK